MIHRRQFFKDAVATAGAVFTGCQLLNKELRAQGPASSANTKKPARQGIVGGRRVKTIDIHAHVNFPEANALMGLTAPPESVMNMARFDTMDEWGCDMQVLSVNAIWYALDQDRVTKGLQLQNEKLAELCSKYPERLAAFGSVALQFPELAAAQLEECIKKYNLKGAAIGGHVNGDELSNPKFDPFWRKAEELGAVIFMHPQGVPELEKRFKGKGGLDNAIGHPLETSIFLSHLIFDGTLDKFPGLKICAAHGGGYLPSYASRSDYVCNRFKDACAGMPKKATEYLKKLYFDALVFTPEGLRHLVAETGVSQIMLGTDYPFPWSTTNVDQVLQTPGLSDADKRAILGENAAKLLKIKL